MPRHWWVNHKQTFRQEIDSTYLWSPKRNANGARNIFYDNMGAARGPGCRSDLAAARARDAAVGTFGRPWLADRCPHHLDRRFWIEGYREIGRRRAA